MPTKHKMKHKDFVRRFEYDPETGAINTKPWKDKRGRPRGGHLCGSLNNRYGYLATGFKINGVRKNYYNHRIAWLLHYGSIDPDMTIDHINGCRTDNRICNLRQLTHKENCQNTHTPSGKYMLGVSLTKEKNRFRARITREGVEIVIGIYDTEIEAHEAYKQFKRGILR